MNNDKNNLPPHLRDNWDPTPVMEFLKAHEGYSSKVYNDQGPKNVATAGYGFTGPHLRRFQQMGSTKEAADTILRDLVIQYYDTYSKLPNFDKMNPNQKNGLVAVGHMRPNLQALANKKGYNREKNIINLMRQERFDEIPNQFTWGSRQEDKFYRDKNGNLVESKVWKGLRNRWADNAKFFHTGDFTKREYNWNGVDPSNGYRYSRPYDFNGMIPPQGQGQQNEEQQSQAKGNNIEVPKVVAEHSGFASTIGDIAKDAQAKQSPISSFAIGNAYYPKQTQEQQIVQQPNPLAMIQGLQPNMFAEGGEIKPSFGQTLAGNIGGIATGIAGLAGSMSSNASINNVSVPKPDLSTPTYKSTKSFLDSYNSWTPQKHISASDLKDPSSGIAGTISSIGAGAGAGATFGPLGAGIGAGVGLIGGIASSIFGSNKAKRRAAQINSEIDRNNRIAQNNFMASAQSTNDMNYMNNEANFFAKGGALKKGGSVSNYKTGFTEFNSGGTHEENPNGGIPQGVGSNGAPNMVEEGETKYKDYVFSNRLFIPKDIAEKNLLGDKLAGKTFAEASKEVMKTLKERPNDPVAKRSVDIIMDRLQKAQEEYKLTNQAQELNPIMQGMPSMTPSYPADAQGDPSVQQADPMAGQQSPNQGIVEQPIAPEGFPAQEQQNQFASGGKITDILRPFASYIPFSTPYYHPSPRETYNANYVEDPSLRVIDDSLGRSISSWLSRAPLSSIPKFTSTNPSTISGATGTTGSTGTNSTGTNSTGTNSTGTNSTGTGAATQNKGPSKIDWYNGKFMTKYGPYLRYAPVLGTGIASLTDALGISNRPDYANADRIERAASSISDINYNPRYLSQRLDYIPLDREYHANKLAAQSSANRGQILNTAGGNSNVAMAGLLASDYNAQQSLGNLYRQAEESNMQNRERVATFNRATDQANSELAYRAAMANQQTQQMRYQAVAQAAQLRENIRNLNDQARSANLTKFVDNAGNLGREIAIANMINTNPALLYMIDPSTGKTLFKSLVENSSK